MKCHACGHENPDTALFCAECRRPLVAPAKLPTPLSAMAPPPPPPPAAPASTMTGLLAPMGSAADAASTVNGRYAPPNADATGPRGAAYGEELTDDEAWGAVVGNANAHYYLERFERISSGGSARWHWPAFFFTWYWLLYRKMWKWAAIYFFAPSIIGGVIGAVAGGSKSLGPALMLAWWAFIFFGPPMLANGLYYEHCQKLIRDVRARGGSKAQILARLEATGGTSGIVAVIVGLFVVIAMVGILAAVAIPAYQTYTQKAKVAEAIISANAVTRAVGRVYEQTGALPSSSDVDRMVSEAPSSRYVRSMSLDPNNGVLTVRVDLPPRVEGSLVFVPKADDQRHVTWTCMTEDLVRYVNKATCSAASPGQ